MVIKKSSHLDQDISMLSIRRSDLRVALVSSKSVWVVYITRLCVLAVRLVWGETDFRDRRRVECSEASKGGRATTGECDRLPGLVFCCWRLTIMSPSNRREFYLDGGSFSRVNSSSERTES